ncbi:MAG: efflux RND transporter periplasmic adaptor subunit [Pseudomonadota bacterium]
MLTLGRSLVTGLVIFAVSSVGSQADDLPPRVAIITDVQTGSDGVTRQFFGTIVARQTVDLAFQVGGQIVELPAQEGEVIPEGGLVAKLDLEPFELQLRQARLQLEQAERNFERLDQLGATVSRAQRDDAETQVGLAQVDLRNAEVALENATLTAPFTALVASRNVANFTTIGQGTPVVRLHDMSELRVEIDVPEVLFQQAGDDADIRLEARFPTSDNTYPLEVREFNAEASSVGQSFRATLALSGAQPLNVLPGSSVTVLATIRQDAPAILVPPTALVLNNDGSTSVMRFLPGEGTTGTVEEVAVTVSANRDGLVEVVDGLAAGDEIVRTGADALSDGQTVRRFEGY